MFGNGDAELCFASAVELARLIRTKQVSAREVLAAHLRQIERVNPRVNAIVTLAEEFAQQAAARADEKQARGEELGALHGLPVAHKDLIETRGMRTTFGSPLFRDFMPPANDLLVDRLQAAGGISVGKTNTPEFGAGSQTFNQLFGATLNPYDLTKTCGGSSGGSAVALACGMVPVADGTDMGGSLRNPAAFCNVVGMRPTVGRVPNPRSTLAWSTLSTSGVMARSAEDLALVLSAVCGPDGRAPLSVQEPGSVFAQPLERDWRGVRVAWFKDLNGTVFDPRVLEVIAAQRKTFEALGCVVEEAEPSFASAEVSFRGLRRWNAAHMYGAMYRKQPDAFKATLQSEIESGLAMSGTDVAEAEAAHADVWRRFQAFLERYEYFVLPTTQVPPFDVKTEYPMEIGGRQMETYIDWMKSCWYISATGNPTISVPGGFTAEGLPVGLQIVGRDRADFSVLQLAHAFEEVTGFGRQRPGFV